MCDANRRLGGSAFVLTFSTMVFTGLTARADSTHYQTLQLGERSRGMAAAYTAFAADGAAIWYNPAGLPLLQPRLLQGSLSLIQHRTLHIQGALVTDGPGGEDQGGTLSAQLEPFAPWLRRGRFRIR
ncbi:MAG: hypothetical protein WCF10_18650 [Polyangiales bacterium]